NGSCSGPPDGSPTQLSASPETNSSPASATASYPGKPSSHSATYSPSPTSRRPHMPDQTPAPLDAETSDGYHTFAELYHYRMLYNAALFNEWAAAGLYDVHKSVRHSDGSTCFGGRWFVVYAQLPTGQISNHYEIATDWY